MEVLIRVEAKVIAALRNFVAPVAPETRDGILLEIGRRESRLVATDDYILGCVRLAYCEPDLPYAPISMIIPLDLFAPVRTRGEVTVVVTVPDTNPLNNEYHVYVSCRGLSADGTSRAVKIIDWRRVIPRETNGKPAQLDTCLLARVEKARAVLFGDNGERLLIAHNGNDGPSVITAGAEESHYEFFGLIMPMRRGEPRTAPPWAHDRLADEVPEPAPSRRGRKSKDESVDDLI